MAPGSPTIGVGVGVAVGADVGEGVSVGVSVGAALSVSVTASGDEVQAARSTQKRLKRSRAMHRAPFLSFANNLRVNISNPPFLRSALIVTHSDAKNNGRRIVGG
jgi:hypothetical protein